MTYNPFYNIENTELLGYEYAWVNYIKEQDVPENMIPPEIFDSWNRCKKRGLCAAARVIPEEEQAEPQRTPGGAEKSKDKLLLEIAPHIMTGMVNTFDVEDVHMLIVGRDGNTHLDVINEKAAGKAGGGATEISGLFRDVREIRSGTNSMDLALRHRRPVSVLGAQHYYQRLHKYADYASPIFGPDGDLLGAIGIIVRTEEMNRYMLAMVMAAANAIENDLRLAESNAIINRQNREKQQILDSITDGVAYVDDNKRITQVNQRLVRLTGIRQEAMIGQDIGIIKTLPGLESMEKNLDNAETDVRIKLCGREGTYNCFINKFVLDEERSGDKSTILVFTVLDDIQMLADKMNTENRAYFTFESIQGNSDRLAEAIELARRAALYETRVIIEGESGTGKEMFAQSIHNAGPRKNGPFVAVDCGAIPRELLESEIFGYEEGAYTGARKGGNRGKFELAHKGTLFLDEIGNMSLEMQAKLLRVLQENKVVRIGGHKPIASNVQVIAATNMDLKSEVENGTFREDLFYRLNIIRIKLPSLRERREDVPMLVNNYIAGQNRISKKTKGIDEEALRILTEYDWPGNVRQLHNIIERMMILSDKEYLTKEVIPAEILSSLRRSAGSVYSLSAIEPLENMTAKYVRRVVERCHGNIKKASEALCITRATVYKFLKKAEEL